jgi:outer membrane protein
MLKKTKLIFIFIILISGFAAAQEQGKKFFTLDECLDIAEKNNFDISIAKNQLMVNKADVRNSFGMYLPSVSYNMGYSRRLNPDGGSTVNVGGQIIPIPSQDPNSFNISTSANLPIFDGFGREGNFRRADSEFESQKAMNEQTRQDVLFQVYNQYISIVRNYQIVNIREQNLELGRKDLERVQAQYDAGVVPVAAVYSQEAEIANREVDLISANNELQSSKAQLMNTMGLMPDLQTEFSVESIPQDINETDILNFRNRVGSLQYAIERALKNRADYKAGEYAVEAAEGSLTMTRSQYMPVLSAAGGWNWSNSEFNNFNENGRSYIGLNLNVPLFQNFEVDKRVQQSKLNLYRQNIILKQTEQNLREVVQRAYLNLESSEKSLEASRRAVKAARQNYESTQERFNVGSANITDLQASNTQFVTARINYVNAVYNYIVSQKQILYSTGELK